MDASQLPKGQSLEVSSDGRPINLPGIYRHRDTGGEFITAEGEAGVIQADTLMSPVWKGAWERVGDVPTRLELIEIRKKQMLEDAKTEAIEKKKEESELKVALEDENPAPGTGVNYEPVLVK